MEVNGWGSLSRSSERSKFLSANRSVGLIATSFLRTRGFPCSCPG